MPFRLSIFVSLVCSALVLRMPNVFAQEKIKVDPTSWPSYRGPFQNLVSVETNLPLGFEGEESILWKREAFGAGSIVTIDDRVFFRAYDRSKREELVVCTKLDSADAVWEARWPVSYSMFTDQNISSDSLPCGAKLAIDHEARSLYVSGGGFIRCLRVSDGKIIWQRCLVEELGLDPASTPFAPLIFEDFLIVGSNRFSTSARAAKFCLLGLDKYTGVTAWEHFGDEANSSSQSSAGPGFPITTVLNGQAAVVFSGTDGSLGAIQPRTGLPIWTFSAPAGAQVAPMAIHNGIVYSGYTVPAEDGLSTSRLFALDGNTQGDLLESKCLWRVPCSGISNIAPVHFRDTVYFVDHTGRIASVDAKSGDTRPTQFDLDSPIIQLAVVHDQLVIITADARLTTYKKSDGINSDEIVARDTSSKLEESRLNDYVAFSKGRLYWPTHEHIVCIGRDNAKPALGPLPDVDKEPSTKDRAIAHIQLCPAELSLIPGQKAPLQVRGFNAAGAYIRNLPEAEFDIDGQATVDDRPVLTTSFDVKQETIVHLKASFGEQSSKVAARLIPRDQSFSFDDGRIPSAWIGPQLAKLSADDQQGQLLELESTDKSFIFFGKSGTTKTELQADFRFRDGSSIVGLVSNRCNVLLTADSLIADSIAPRTEPLAKKDIDRKQNDWYTVLFRAETDDGQLKIKAQIWERGESVPEGWAIDTTLAGGDKEGACGIVLQGACELDNVVKSIR